MINIIIWWSKILFHQNAFYHRCFIDIIKYLLRRHSILEYSIFTSSGIISRNLTSCERETDAVRWYSTSSLRLLNLTTHRKNLPCASLNTLKCCTPSEHLYIYINWLFYISLIINNNIKQWLFLVCKIS